MSKNVNNDISRDSPRPSSHKAQFTCRPFYVTASLMHKLLQRISQALYTLGSCMVSPDIYWYETIYGKSLHKTTNQWSNHYMLRGDTGNTKYLGHLPQNHCNNIIIITLFTLVLIYYYALRDISQWSTIRVWRLKQPVSFQVSLQLF